LQYESLAGFQFLTPLTRFYDVPDCEKCVRYSDQSIDTK
jgi:hypothetical protein